MSRPETPQAGINARAARDTQPETDHDEQTCQGCGAHVSPDFRRVFGNNQDLVGACPECTSDAELYRGAAARELNGGGS